MRSLAIFAATIAIVSAVLPVQAATLFTFPFTNNYDPSVIDSSLSTVGLGIFPGTSPGNAIIRNNGFGRILSVFPATGVTDTASALAQNVFLVPLQIGFTAQPTSNGNTVNLATLSFEVGKGGASGPRGYFIRSTADNLSSDIIAELLPDGQDAPVQRTVNLSAPIYQNVTSVNFLFYVYAPAGANNSVDFRNVSVTSPGVVVPEASTGLLALCVVPALGVLVRRRR
ncbi:MAG: hypothetical protein H7Y38_10925 [Armatimonadetes bacterium]|nr:hypothetical protein [Armatimonadota bacterium]